MSKGKFPYTPELKPFQAADDAWQIELDRVCARTANARYTEEGKGAPGSKLRRLYDARMEAKRVWRASADPE